MQMNKDCSMLITASKDNTARLFDATELIPLKVYKTERPVNSAALSPIRDHVNSTTNFIELDSPIINFRWYSAVVRRRWR